MLKSMTGYGRGICENEKRIISVEIRSINHRYSEITVKAPRVYSFLEDSAKKYVGSFISRGKTDVFISVKEKEDDSVTVELNKTLVNGYINAASVVAETYQMAYDLSVSNIIRMPDALIINKNEPDVKEITEQMLSAISFAAQDFDKMRSDEGARLCDDILYRAGLLSEFVDHIEKRSEESSVEYKNKLAARMKEVLGDSDITEQRILAEAALYADKISVTEELIRLRSHIKQLRGMINKSEPCGRKLDFLIQEFNREANTIGSKACDLDITQKVVDMKAEIEKIREQIQNLE